MTAINQGMTFHWNGISMPVMSPEDAAQKWRKCIEEAGYPGVSEVGNGGVVKENGKIVARISYNGRIWGDK